MIIEKLESLFQSALSENCLKVTKLPLSGSNREYYRMYGANSTAIAAYNPIQKENEAFIHFTEVFKTLRLNVPAVLANDLKNGIYLLEDLGDTTAFEYIITLKEKSNGETEIFDLFKLIIEKLILFQLKTYKYINFEKAFPRHSFDKQSIMWDLNYFKYYFLKLLHINFDEQLLEDDFNTFANYLTSAESQYFMYRDFQCRNIMLKDNELYFIDYQGGRKGPLQYDLASLLYSAKTDLPEPMRDKLLDYYIIKINGLVSEKELLNFRDYYYSFVLVRILQALGAYGYRGLYEKKEYFVKSIPLAIENLKRVLQKLNIPCALPELMASIDEICKPQNNKHISELC